MKIALAQVNPTIGDIDGNVGSVMARLVEAEAASADLVVFPEQSILGYPAKDLVLRREVIERNLNALARLTARTRATAVLIGFAEPRYGRPGRALFNSAALLHNGKEIGRWRKQLLPTYDVFDEGRYFEPAEAQGVIEFAGRRMGVTICEDLLWDECFGQTLYRRDPAADLGRAGADLVINLSASPYWQDKQRWRESRVAQHAAAHGYDVVFVNQVGGNDELVFDGSSMVIDRRGRASLRMPSFREALAVVELEAGGECRLIGGDVTGDPPGEWLSGPAAMFEALVLGTRDYARKCGFSSAVLGLSGGIDSAVTAVVATEALGPGNVHGVVMPSRYSSGHSIEDARQLSEALGIRVSTIPIEPMHAAFEQALRPHFGGREPDVTEENIQARVRGTILMSLSNKFGSLLLTTGNKSEIAVGYCTLYGDMAGGLAVISDVPKTAVYALARYINASCRVGRAPIPERTISKPPSAELRPNQTDQDTLPPYEVLDGILERYEERLLSREQIVSEGFDAATVDRVLSMIQRSEYKRRQAAPGLKVTTRAFGFGRRMPIAMK